MIAGIKEAAITARFILKSYVVDENKVQGRKIGKLHLEGWLFLWAILLG